MVTRHKGLGKTDNHVLSFSKLRLSNESCYQSSLDMRVATALNEIKSVRNPTSKKG